MVLYPLSATRAMQKAALAVMREVRENCKIALIKAPRPACST